MLTLGLILFPTRAGTPGAGRGAPGVTNARPRPGLLPPRSCSQLFIKSMCVPLALPGNGGWGRGLRWAPLETLACTWASPARNPTCTHVLYPLTHSLLPRATPRSYAHRQPRCPRPDAQLNTGARSLASVRTAVPAPRFTHRTRSVHARHASPGTSMPPQTHKHLCAPCMYTRTHRATHVRTLLHTSAHAHTFVTRVRRVTSAQHTRHTRRHSRRHPATRTHLNVH